MSNGINNFPPEQIEALRKSVEVTFESICGNIEYKGAVDEDAIWLTEGIVGIISLIGDVSWSVSLGFPKETAVPLSKTFAGFEIDYDSEDMNDVTGELINVLAGDTVAQLDAIGITVDMSLPTIARGTKMEVHVPDRLPRVQLLFKVPDGEFAINLTAGKYHERKKN